MRDTLSDAMAIPQFAPFRAHMYPCRVSRAAVNLRRAAGNVACSSLSGRRRHGTLSKTVLPSRPPKLVPVLKALRLGGMQETLSLRLD